MFGRGGYAARRFALVGLIGLLPDEAWAIPAPDLIVSSVSSLSQLLAMLSVVLGGGLFFGTRFKPGAGKQQAFGAYRGLYRIAFGIVFALLLGSAGLNIWQWEHAEQQKQARLQATLNRPAVERGKPIHDPTLRELPYSKQVEHPLRIDTHSVLDLLEDRRKGQLRDYLFIDTRENIETRMGSIDGFLPIRAPDLWAAVKDGTIDVRDKKIIVICHNGNRSFETAEALANQGVSARFVAGGFEKWFVEGLPITGLNSRTDDSLRAVLPYPNDLRLLDTDEVTKLVQTERAIFLDVRYEKEFELWHLPDAINITMRKMTTSELAERIGQLPRRPLIIACYDRRGCFAARVLGYELHRAGFDFRGRYTVPWEYFEPVPLGQALPHVAHWKALANQSSLDHAKVVVSEALYNLAERTGSLIWGVLLIALLSRLIVLPFTLRAERDQIQMARLKPEIDALKSRLSDDPTRLLRAVREVYRRHDINPARGLLSLLFLPFFFISIAAIELAADATLEPFLWMRELGEPDPYFILPALFSILIVVYIERGTPLSWRMRLFAWLLGAPLLTVAMADIGAAANLYAVISAVLVLVQRELIVLLRDLPRLRALRLASRSGIVPLSFAHTVDGTGIKASRLGQLIQHGFPVPPGLVITSRKTDDH